MRDIVAAEYPEREAHIPEAARQGEVPASVLASMRAMQEVGRAEEKQGRTWCKRTNLIREKNATPPPRGEEASKCLDRLRPMAMCADRTNAADREPGVAREGALKHFGNMMVQTGSRYLSQWCPEYFSQILPFVIPRMVSGADFQGDTSRPWRRQRLVDAPLVAIQDFVRAFARRVEGACRLDWCALPILRSVSQKYQAENTMNVATTFIGRRGWTAATSATEWVQAAKNIFGHLCNGYIGQGISRTPIAGDTTKLHLAHGLTPLEKRLVLEFQFLAKNMPGSQQIRQLMGHTHFGARVVYGDCIFFTISPNELHSALVLRLSRYRRNDPYVKYSSDDKAATEHRDSSGKSFVERNAAQDYPLLEADAVSVDLPEYDLRCEAAARDPLAVIEAYRVEIYLRLAAVLGVRMCPHCPRCNEGPHAMGCQDKFGSNMRPVGGNLGGMMALGGATEHQGHGTPHLHAEGHIVCAYQYATMTEIAELFRQKKISVAAFKQYSGWLHREEVFVSEQHEEYAPKAQTEFFDHFAKCEHAGLSQTPVYQATDAEEQSEASILNVSTVQSQLDLDAVYKEGADFMVKYKADLQFIFNRVQHHIHKKTAHGFQPLKACRCKSQQGSNKVQKRVCKSGFPLHDRITTKPLLVCRGIAHKFKLRISGRRNAFGTCLNQRSCEWQSGTAPAFAALFRSNTHTLPNYRAPLLPETHEDTMCDSSTCKVSFLKCLRI